MYGNQIFYTFNESQQGLFEYNEDEDSVELQYVITDSTMIDNLQVIFTGWLDYYQAYQNIEGFEKVGTEKIAGRDCSKYTVGLKRGENSFMYTFWIDDEYKICMKYVATFTDSTQTTGLTFEVPEFKTSGVSLPCDDSAYTTQIDGYFEELRETYSGNWVETEQNPITYEWEKVDGGKKVTISDDFIMNYDGTEYKMVLNMSIFVVKKEGSKDNKFTIMPYSDGCLMINDNETSEFLMFMKE